ncbi:MAG: lysine--tRNA ligase [Candidatus Omnitrophota bacterium]
MSEENTIFNDRLAKLNKLKLLGVEPFGRRFEKTHRIADIVVSFQEGIKVSIAGRMTAVRSHGKSVFFDLKDETGRIQAYIKLDLIGEKNFEIFNSLDIGDILGVTGEVFKTRTGEPTVKVDEFIVLSKSLRNLPEKWHGLKDVETRYRQRYLDLIANEDSKKVLLARTRIISLVRSFLEKKGFIEVETPMLHAIPGGAAGKPFKTHHNEYDVDLYLRIAPELYLKRLLVGGLEKVYEINKSFRNEGISTKHNPEFTMLEAYWAYADCSDMMKLTEEMLVYLIKEINGSTAVQLNGREFDFSPPWRIVSFAEKMKTLYGIEPGNSTEEWLNKLKVANVKVELDKAEKITRSKLSKIIEDLLENEKENKPAFFVDLFSEFCPLAKVKKDNPLLSDRFELYIGDLEVANAYTEQNDPIEQKRRFEEQLREAEKDDIKQVDYDFVEALEYGMPPAGGLGIGIDRLVMVLTGSDSIRDVILFPQLKPQQ